MAKLGFRAALVVEQVSPAWPPSGLALWAVLILRRRAWAGIWLGALIANLTTDVPPFPAATIAIGNTLEAIVGAWLLREFADVDRSLDRLRQVTALIVLGAIASTTVGATIGVISLCAAGLQSWSSFGMLWRTWWLGDAMGDVLLAPLLLTLPFWISPRRDGSWFEIVSLEALAIVLGVLVFSSHVAPLASASARVPGVSGRDLGGSSIRPPRSRADQHHDFADCDLRNAARAGPLRRHACDAGQRDRAPNLRRADRGERSRARRRRGRPQAVGIAARNRSRARDDPLRGAGSPARDAANPANRV